jgi:hypothetical protein
VTLGNDTAYIAGKFIVIYRRDPESSPRMRMSRPDAAVVSITSLSTAPDHSRVAAVEHLEQGRQRITFWDADMTVAQSPIACDVKVYARPALLKLLVQHIHGHGPDVSARR